MAEFAPAIRLGCLAMAAAGPIPSCGGSGGSPAPSPSPTARPAAAARGGHATAYDEARAQVVLFGGNGTTLFGDLWAWNGAA